VAVARSSDPGCRRRPHEASPRPLPQWVGCGLGGPSVRISSSRLQVPPCLQRLGFASPARRAGVGGGARAGRARSDRGGRVFTATRRSADAGPRWLSSEPTWSGVGGIGGNRSPLGIPTEMPCLPSDRSRHPLAGLTPDEISILVYANISARRIDMYHKSGLMSNLFDFSGKLSTQQLNHRFVHDTKSNHAPATFPGGCCVTGAPQCVSSAP